MQPQVMALLPFPKGAMRFCKAVWKYKTASKNAKTQLPPCCPISDDTWGYESLYTLSKITVRLPSSLGITKSLLRAPVTKQREILCVGL